MQNISKGQNLQSAYREHIAAYADFIQIAVTLTLKTSTKIRVKRFNNYGDEYYEFLVHLNEEILNSRIHYFTALLRYEIFGRAVKRKNKQHLAQLIVIAVTEGRNTHKRTHFHLAIGNIPPEKLGNIEETIKRIWQRCDFANKHVCTKKVTCGKGWLDYMTKEIGYTDNDVLDIVSCTIPQFIQSSFCAESRLLTL